jgi:hypothetical protein
VEVYTHANYRHDPNTTRRLREASAKLRRESRVKAAPARAGNGKR